MGSGVPVTGGGVRGGTCGCLPKLAVDEHAVHPLDRMAVELEGSGFSLSGAEAKRVLHEGDEGGGDGAAPSQGHWVVEENNNNKNNTDACPLHCQIDTRM